MSNQVLPAVASAEDKGLNLLKPADPADIQILKKYCTQNFGQSN
mgnify:CR=1 FL=1